MQLHTSCESDIAHRKQQRVQHRLTASPSTIAELDRTNKERSVSTTFAHIFLCPSGPFPCVQSGIVRRYENNPRCLPGCQQIIAVYHLDRSIYENTHGVDVSCDTCSYTYRYGTAALRSDACVCTTGRYALLLMPQYRKSTTIAALALLIHYDIPGTCYYCHEWSRP